MGRCFHFLLFFLLSVSARENKIKIPLFLSQESPWIGRKKMKEFEAFHTSNLTQFLFSFLQSPYQAVSNSRIQTPSEINPEELVLLCPKEHPKRGVTC